MPRALATAATDAELMSRIADADSGAFEVLYDRYETLAFSLAAKITGHRGLAEEVTQEAFFGLWRSAGRYDESRGSARVWLLTLVRNRGIDLLRSRARRPSDEALGLGKGTATEPASTARTDEQALAGVEAERVRGLVRDLPPTQREAVELAYFGGLTHTEIASRLELPLSTIKGRQRLALMKLQRALGGSAESARCAS